MLPGRQVVCASCSLSSESWKEIQNVLKTVHLEYFFFIFIIQCPSNWITFFQMMTSWVFDKFWQHYCLQCRGFTDVWENIITFTVVPMFVPTNCRTVLISVTWLSWVPFYKTQCTVVWRPKKRPVYGNVSRSDPVCTTIPPIRWTNTWEKERECDK